MSSTLHVPRIRCASGVLWATRRAAPCFVAIAIALVGLSATSAYAASTGSNKVDPSNNASPSPTIITEGSGLTDFGWYPPDWNNAASSTRYIQIINNEVAFYGTSLSMISSSTTFSLAASSDSYLSDPGVYFDPASNRFYYTMMDQSPSGTWYLDWGFSRTSSPKSVSDFCHYRFITGSMLPDFPKLGGTRSFLMVGVNSGTSPSRVYWAHKPGSAAMTTCPASISQGVTSVAMNPVIPMRVIDPTKTTYILQADWSSRAALDIITVSQVNSKLVFGSPRTIPVAAFTAPAQAPQPGSTYRINVGDILNNGVQAWDPDYGRQVIWTTQEVGGGAGAAIRWYEIDPAAGVILAQGMLTDPSLYLFNAAISPDREYLSSTHTGFGMNMVITYNSSSTNSYVAMWVASSRAGSPLSAPLEIAQAAAPLQRGCDSSSNICRWGDIAGASAAVGSSLTNPTGHVWVTNGTVDSSGDYNSFNVEVAP